MCLRIIRKPGCVSEYFGYISGRFKRPENVSIRVRKPECVSECPKCVPGWVRKPGCVSRRVRARLNMFLVCFRTD